MTDPPQLPPAGWHPDPEQPETWRYWNGAEWTEQRAPMVPPEEQHRPPPATLKDWIFNHPVWSALIALFAVAIVIGALSPGSEEDEGSTTTTENAASEGQTPAEERKVGNQHQCEQRLNELLSDKQYLREAGIASLTALDREVQVTTTCREVAGLDLTVDDAGNLATHEIVDRLGG